MKMLMRKLKRLETQGEAAAEMQEAGWNEQDVEYSTLVAELVKDLPVLVGIDETNEIESPIGFVREEKVAYIVGGRLYVEEKRVYKRGLDLWISDKEIS